MLKLNYPYSYIVRMVPGMIFAMDQKAFSQENGLIGVSKDKG